MRPVNDGVKLVARRCGTNDWALLHEVADGVGVGTKAFGSTEISLWPQTRDTVEPAARLPESAKKTLATVSDA